VAERNKAVNRVWNFLAPWGELFTLYPLPTYPVAIVTFGLIVCVPGISAFDFASPFYEAAAQIFPVLLLAMFGELIFEAKAFERYVADESDPQIVANLENARFQRAVAVLCTVLIGEVGALWALADNPSLFLAGVTSASLALAAGTLLGPFLYRIRPGAKKGIYGW
jgi:hypothetical protein